MGIDRLARRCVEGLDGARHERDDHDVPDLHHVQEGQDSQKKDQTGVDGLGGHNQQAFVQLVGINAAEYVEKYAGHGVCRGGVAQEQG